MRVYERLQHYYDDKEFELMKLAMAFNSIGWRAAAAWHKDMPTLIVRGPKSVAKNKTALKLLVMEKKQ
jgi:hypothetical protein